MPFGVAAPREVAIGQLYDKLDSDASIIQEVTIKKNDASF
jgi:hypothetical protein